jgi:hypothetical protein
LFEKEEKVFESEVAEVPRMEWQCSREKCARNKYKRTDWIR